jgi:aryl-alcohol dehydrogenase-like predicted oxidoreductase
MEYRRLGKTGLEVSVLGFGCAQIASVSTAYSRSEIKHTIYEALDAGITFFDTADVYGQGDSERLLGDFASSQRQNMVICTKAGLRVNAPVQLLRITKPITNWLLRKYRPASRTIASERKRREGYCFEPQYIRTQVEGSLRRLRTDYVDLFLLHNPPADALAREDLFAELDRLRAIGSLLNYGISCRGHEDAVAYASHANVSAVQIPLNIHSIAGAGETLERLSSAHIGIIAREPFSGGSLIAETDGVALGARDGAERPLSEVALKAVVQQAEVDVVVTGMGSPIHLRNNLSALYSKAVSDAEISSARMCSSGTTHGI